MTQGLPPNPFVEAKLLGIMLSGIFGQTRDDCSEETRLRLELPASGAYRIGSRGVENTLTEGAAGVPPATDPLGPGSR
jgi:hypothetical protein